MTNKSWEADGAVLCRWSSVVQMEQCCADGAALCRWSSVVQMGRRPYVTSAVATSFVSGPGCDCAGLLSINFPIILRIYSHIYPLFSAVEWQSTLKYICLKAKRQKWMTWTTVSICFSSLSLRGLALTLTLALSLTLSPLRCWSALTWHERIVHSSQVFSIAENTSRHVLNVSL